MKPGFFYIQSKNDLQRLVNLLFEVADENESFQVQIKIDQTRSEKQNNALHKYFELLAQELNVAGYTVVPVVRELKNNPDIPWTKSTVKEILWKTIQKHVVGHDHTSKLEKPQVARIYDVVHKFTSERFGVGVLFPERNQ